MSSNISETSLRKKEHLELCMTDDVSFKEKQNGFDNYDFVHYAITEVELDKVNFTTKFLGKKINFPFLISCMTGGTSEAENINGQLAVAASRLNIALGVGSQRQALEGKQFHHSYKIIRKNAPSIPLLGNIGAAQLVKMNSVDQIRMLIELVEADALVVHVNPLQELIQRNGEPNFRNLLKKIKWLVSKAGVPVIVKEVGSGISKEAAAKLLDAGVKGIDVAGSGGTSWAAVEILRNKETKDDFWDWGLPTSYCLRTIYPLKKKFNFNLIASGGINNPFHLAKAFALGADISASARIVLQSLNKSGVEGVVRLIESWFGVMSKIMFLTGSKNLKELRKNKIKRRELLI
jgi:isopentenyl-diphosphate delta-isomerase